MTDIDTTIAEVKRLDAEATPGEWRAEADPGTDCEACLETSSPQAALVRSYHSAGGIAVVLTDDREKANAALIAYYRTAAPLLAAEVERLRAEVDRLTRDRDRLAGYVRAARQLSRDAHTHLLEERPEEAARTIFRVICALASAEKEGDDR